MRLSDVKGERTLDVIADLVEPIASIAQDGDAALLFKPQPLAEGQTREQEFGERARKAIPALLKTHKSDVILILATIAGVEPQEYADNMDLAGVVNDIYELITDEAFLAFLS